MKTLNLVNKNTRKNARTLTNYLKAQGIKATAPSAKNDQGLWDVKASVKRVKSFYVVNKGIASKVKSF